VDAYVLDVKPADLDGLERLLRGVPGQREH
jgi:hypothetical protein